MKTTDGDMWKGLYAGRVVPTNGIWHPSKSSKYEGWPEAVMGAGVAQQAAERHPILPILLGYALQEFGNHVFAFDLGFHDGNEADWILTFPTKRDYRDPSDIQLVEQSAHELAVVARSLGLESVVLPQVGTGLGGLDWQEVEPVLQRYLDDRFIAITFWR